MLKSNKIKNLKLNNKMFGIHITNICNLSCGGCDQFCGYFNKNKNFFISIEEFKKNINNFIKYKNENWVRKEFPEEDKIVLLYGGEPTLHPKFNEIINIIHSYEDIPFCIYTNGRTFMDHFVHIDLAMSSREISCEVYKTKTLPKNGYLKFKKIFNRFHSHDKNVAYRIDLKTSDSKGKFVPTLCAPHDLDKKTFELSKLDMWKRAQKICYKWNQCENSIYRDKAYVCNVAASMDNMFYDGKYGWKISPNENPFNKTNKEVDEQMQNFCYRCGYNFHGCMNYFEENFEKSQYNHKGSMITKSNMQSIDKKSKNFQRLELVQIENKEKVPPEVFR